MRIGKIVALAMLLTACTGAVPHGTYSPPPRSVTGEPPAKPPLPPPGPRQLEISSRTNGWVLKATTESSTGRDELNGPLGLWWLGPDRAIVRWYWNPDTEFYLVDLTVGTMQRLDGYVDIRTDSPDGRHVVNHLPAQSHAWLTEVATGRRIWRLPGPDTRETWLSPTLLHVAYGRQAVLYDLASGKETPLPEAGAGPVLLADREICYAREVERVSCVPLAGGTPKLLTPEKLHPDVINAGPRLAWDPGRRYLSMLYPKAPALSWRFSGTAYAMSPVVHAWVNELAVYDGVTGKVNRYPLGREYIREGVAWSADGSYLVMALGRMERKGQKVTPKGTTEFWRLATTTGALTKVTEVRSESARLDLVTKGGEVVYRAAHDQQPLIAAPGERPRPWASGLTLLPQQLTGMPPGAMAFTGPDVLEVRTVDGAVRRWPWEGAGDAHISAAMGPEGRWAAIHIQRPGAMIFLGGT